MKRMIIVCAFAAALVGCEQRENAGGVGQESSQQGTVSDKNDSPTGRTGADTNASGPGARGGTGTPTGRPSSERNLGEP